MDIVWYGGGGGGDCIWTLYGQENKFVSLIFFLSIYN